VVQAAGYREESRFITRKPSGAVRGNIWLGGLIGWLVDALTGADNNLVPDQLHVVLQPTVASRESTDTPIGQEIQSLQSRHDAIINVAGR